MRKSIFAITLLFPALLLGQTEKLTIDDLLGPANGNLFGRGFGGPIQSADGKFTAAFEDGQIAIRLSDGGTAKVLTSTHEPKSELALASDGSKVAYISQGQVWVVPVAGGEPLELTHDPTGPGDPRGATDHHPQWNPNGKWILYESGQKGFNEIYVVCDDGRTLNLLAATEIYHGKDVIANPGLDHGDAVSSDRFDPRPQWSPDGKRISYTERSREYFSGKLKVLPFDQQSGHAAGSAIDVYVAQNDPGGAWAINTAAWSPDGKTLAVILQETHRDKIWTIPDSGSKPKELTFGEGEDEEPVYSPDGKWIARIESRIP